MTVALIHGKLHTNNLNLNTVESTELGSYRQLCMHNLCTEVMAKSYEHTTR